MLIPSKECQGLLTHKLSAKDNKTTDIKLNKTDHDLTVNPHV